MAIKIVDKKELKETFIKDIAEAREDVRAGRVYDLEDVCKELGLENCSE